MNQTKPAAVPLLIGIIGHTELPIDEISRLRETLRERLQNLRLAYPNTPIKLMVPLLPGAGLLAAELALEMRLDLIAILSLPQEMFLALHPTYRCRLEAILDKVEHVFKLPKAKTSIENTDITYETMELQHLSAGAWLCRYSHEIIALWNPHATDSCTSRIAGFRLEGIPPYLGENRSLLRATETGPLTQIPLYVTSEAPSVWRTLLPADRRRDKRNEHWQSIDLFNYKANAAQLSQPEIDSHSPEGVPQTLKLSGIEMQIARIAATARHISTIYRTKLSLILAGLFIFTALCSIGLQAISMSDLHLPMAVIYALFFMVVGSIYMWGLKTRWNTYQLEYQALAEILTVQLVWRIAGIKDASFDHLLLKHTHCLHWVQEALRPAALPTPTELSQTPQAILTEWVEHKIRWHSTEAVRLERRANIFHKMVLTFYGISLGLTLIMLLPANLLPPSAADYLGPTLGICASFGTLSLIFGGNMGYTTGATTHQRMLKLFAAASNMLKQALPDYETKELLVDLGKESLQAAGDWVFMHR